MGVYKYIKDLWKTPKKNMPDLWKERLVAWRQEPVTQRIDRPTRLDRARALGYKAKQGYIVVRQRVARGGRQRETIRNGRKPGNTRRRKILDMSYQTIAERRANAVYTNCEVLNSYWVAQDGKNFWYEVILVDKSHPAVLADKNISWIANPTNRGRVYRGLTSSQKKTRGLRNKGKGAEKVR